MDLFAKDMLQWPTQKILLNAVNVVSSFMYYHLNLVGRFEFSTTLTAMPLVVFDHFHQGYPCMAVWSKQRNRPSSKPTLSQMKSSKNNIHAASNGAQDELKVRGWVKAGLQT